MYKVMNTDTGSTMILDSEGMETYFPELMAGELVVVEELEA